MKRSRAILLVLVVLTALLAACTDKGAPEASATPVSTPVKTPAPTVPDYSGVDFSGTWTVYALYDSSGAPVSSDQMAAAGANFSLELLDSGTYFLYDTEGKPIGQGQYAIDKDKLTMTAGGQQTVYAIEDADTLRCTAQDGSATVMKRCQDECVTDGEEEIPPEDTETETTPEVTETESTLPEG